MSEPTHTPGPWRFSTEDGHVHDEDGLIAEVWGVFPGRDGSEVKANARLIAAAPELLAAVKAFNAFVDEYEPCPACSHSPHSTDCFIPKAIAKAEGRTVNKP
jgi:hypothetical protein